MACWNLHFFQEQASHVGHQDGSKLPRCNASVQTTNICQSIATGMVDGNIICSHTSYCNFRIICYNDIVKNLWRVWAKALGDKSGKSNKEADTIAIIRTLIFVQLVITNCFIVAGNIRHWNDHYTPPQYEVINGVSCTPSTTQKSLGEKRISI